MVLDRLDDEIRAAAAELAGSLCGRGVSSGGSSYLRTCCDCSLILFSCFFRLPDSVFVRGLRIRPGWVCTYRRTGLDEELAHGGAVVHGIEGSDLVDAHGGHLEDAGDLVHDADAGKAVLALAQVEDRHDGGLLVLRRIALEELGDDGLILRREFEGDLGVVVGRVSVLCELARDEVSFAFRAMVGVWESSRQGQTLYLVGKEGKS